MADSTNITIPNDVGFWLPSDFLTDQHINSPFGSSFFFQNSSVQSLIESEPDDDELLTGLTRHFANSFLNKHPPPPPQQQKNWWLSESPQSPLSPAFSPSGTSKATSPTSSLLSRNDDAWDLICAASGKMKTLKLKTESTRSAQNFAPFGLYRTISYEGMKNVGCGSSIWEQQQQQQVYQNKCSRICCAENSGGFRGNGRCARTMGLLQEFAWPSLGVGKNELHPIQPVANNAGGVRAAPMFSGVGVKRGCAGTGVFLPRRYDDVKSGSSTTSVPAQAVHKSVNPLMITNRAQSLPQPQPHYNAGVFSEYDMLMARRNALIAAQQRRNGMRAEGGGMNYEMRLPQEWTY